MEKIDKMIDGNGNLIQKGDWVTFEKAPDSLLKNLPTEDQEAIKLQAKKPMQVVELDKSGYVEMEFIADNGTFHTIWIKPEKLFKV